MNILAALVTHSLIALWAYPKHRARQRDLCNVIHHDTLVILHAVNLRAVFECFVEVSVNLNLSFHASNYIKVTIKHKNYFAEVYFFLYFSQFFIKIAKVLFLGLENLLFFLPCSHL